jgi:hypothetical protein
MMIFGGNTALGNGKHQSLYTPFHEIAQINVAKKLYEMTGQKVELEKSLETKEREFFGLRKKRYEADIVLGNEVWEVKPLKGKDPKPQLELYKKLGGLTEGKQLNTISGITVFDQIKMEINFPNKGEARYSMYIQNDDGTRKALTTVGAATIIAKGLSKMTPLGKRLSPGY